MEAGTDRDILKKYIIRDTCREKVADGRLLSIGGINHRWNKGVLSHVSVRLLKAVGAMDQGGGLNYPVLVKLLDRANILLRDKSYYFKKYDLYYTGFIDMKRKYWSREKNLPGEVPEKFEILIEHNECGKYTVMLAVEW